MRSRNTMEFIIDTFSKSDEQLLGSKESKKTYQHKETPWRLIIICIIFLFAFGLFVFYPPAKNMLYNMKLLLQSYGLYGHIFLVIFVGLFVVPVGLPYTMFQMMFALMTTDFWLALLLTSLAQILGSAVAYSLSKHVLREKLKSWLHSQKIFKAIETIISKQPIKFSILINLTNLPLIVKNYALAIPNNSKFDVYILASTIGAVFTSAPQICILQQAEELTEAFEPGTNIISSKTVITVIMTVLSVLLIAYISWYTIGLLKEIEEECKLPQDIEMKKMKHIDKNIVEYENI